MAPNITEASQNCLPDGGALRNEFPPISTLADVCSLHLPKQANSYLDQSALALSLPEQK